MGFAPLYKREISLGPLSDSDQEMHCHAEVKSLTKDSKSQDRERVVSFKVILTVKDLGA